MNEYHLQDNTDRDSGVDQTWLYGLEARSNLNLDIEL